MTTTEHAPAHGSGPLKGLRLVLGGTALVLGVAVLVSPGATLLVVAILFGLQLLVSGLVRLTIGLRAATGGGHRLLAVVLAAVTVLAGAVCLLQPGTSLFVLAVSVAVGWLSDGVAELAAGLTPGRSGPGRAALIVLGAVSITSAALMIIFPDMGLVVLTRLGGNVLIVLGLLTLVTALRLRR